MMVSFARIALGNELSDSHDQIYEVEALEGEKAQCRGQMTILPKAY